MAKVLSPIKMSERNHENFVIATTNSSNSKRKRFSQGFVSVERVGRFIAKSPNSRARNYRSGVGDLGHDSSHLQFLRPRLKPTVGCVQSGHSYPDLATLLTSKILRKFPELVIPRLPSKQQEIKVNKESESESDEIEPFWRGVFVVPHHPKILFSQEMELKPNKPSTWKRHVVIDISRLEDDDE
jgi:hypothetical protein